jgi:predicted transglutaminase-like cysteine proteinase
MMVITVISRVFSARLCAVLITGLACSTHAFPASAGAKRLSQLTHIPVSEVTQPPVGWIEFCAREPNECAGATKTVRDFVITPKRWNDLVRVNKLVNAAISPLTDFEHWGVVERWLGLLIGVQRKQPIAAMNA